MGEWHYWRLLSIDGRVVGFRRERKGEQQFYNGRGDEWVRQPIEYDEAIRLTGCPVGMHYMKGPK